jgi:anti-sigma factor RsiW
MTMTKDEARDAMSDAFEGELPEPQRLAFEALLAEDEELREEWEAFKAMMQTTRAVGLDVAPPIQLLGGVQQRIRARSRGRFYRDRFATMRRGEMILPVVLGVVTIVIFTIAWAAMSYVEIAPR